ncbi:MAG: UDP-N-acetylmuramoyl-L-alanine--D-glutamate ligase [Erysipelotrichaceae bacterium]
MPRVLLIGAAKSGIACAKLLLAQGYEVVLNDGGVIADQENLEAMGIVCIANAHPETLLDEDFAFVVKNPGIPYHVPFIQKIQAKGWKIYTEVEIGYRYAKNFHYGAITGTNGKTTITTLLGLFLDTLGNGCVAGNIGTPLSELALLYGQAEKNVAIELSNFQLLGCERFAPHIATITNLTPDHLDYMGSVESYYQSKCKIYENQSADDFFILNLDDENVVAYAKNIPSHMITMSLDKPANLTIKNREAVLDDVVLFSLDDLLVVGAHNISNCLTAAAMAYLMGVSPLQIQLVLQQFHGVKHRLQYVTTLDGVRYYNDSKATNPEAACIALQAFEGNIILLAGGSDKGLPFTCMHAYDTRVKHCFAFGETRNAIAATFSRSTIVNTMQEALTQAQSIAQRGDVVVLAPACASFDQFKSFEDRGDQFIKMLVD